MKKELSFKINDQYSAGVEIDDKKVLIWIEQKCKFLLVFNDTERVSHIEAFHLVTRDKPTGHKTPSLTSYTLCGSFRGYIQHLTFQYIYIEDFDLKNQIIRLYNSYIYSKNKEMADEKKLNRMIDEIININL